MMKTFETLIFAIITLFQLTTTRQETCGVARIVKVGDESKLHFPWAGALYNVVNTTAAGDGKYICGASLLTESHGVTGKSVITMFTTLVIDLHIPAGHCIQDKHSNGYRRSPGDIIVYFGMYDLKQKNATGFAIEQIVLHQDWNPLDESYDADIAILKLRNAITFSNLISPICLWPTSDEEIVKGTVISWTEPGLDDPGYWNYEHDPLHSYPQRFDMPIRSNMMCLLMQPRFKPIASERTFCAGGLNSGQCLEVGNSGASMAVRLGDKFFLKGVVSASFIDIAGCDNITFTLFTDIGKFKSWIIGHIKEL